nr:thymidylate synthase [uncultured Oscillibacter sp.]
MRTIYKEGPTTEYTDNAGEHADAKEIFGLTFTVLNANLPDAIIERHKVQAEYGWMVRNFTVQEHVKELHNETPYASRLCSYMGQKDQIQWVIDRLRENPHTRSAAVTTLEPLTDEGYIPCVSLLDFQEEAGALNLTVYCRALDFGCKAYVNLVMLYTILQTVSEKAGMRHGRLTLIVKSAHYYCKDEDKVRHILRAEGAI